MVVGGLIWYCILLVMVLCYMTALLMKVLLDPAVDQSLRENISHKRQEALTKCSEMEALIHHKQRFAVHTLSLFLKSTLLLTHKHKGKRVYLYTTRESKSYTVQRKGRVIVGP